MVTASAPTAGMATRVMTGAAAGPSALFAPRGTNSTSAVLKRAVKGGLHSRIVAASYTSEPGDGKAIPAKLTVRPRPVHTRSTNRSGILGATLDPELIRAED